MKAQITILLFISLGIVAQEKSYKYKNYNKYKNPEISTKIKRPFRRIYMERILYSALKELRNKPISISLDELLKYRVPITDASRLNKTYKSRDEFEDTVKNLSESSRKRARAIYYKKLNSGK